MKIVAICLIISSLFLQSCGKQCNSDTPIVEINPTIIEYFGMYKQGNWWIYENTKKNKRDSVFVTDFFQYGTCNEINNTRQKFREMKINSEFIGESVEKKYLLNLSITSVILPAMSVFLDLDSKMEKFVSGRGTISLIDTLMPTTNISFTKVFKISTQNAFPHNIFIAPNVGIVKFENDRDTFNLIKFKIN